MKTKCKETSDHGAQPKAEAYATERDFCNIFTAEMQPLYVLALMLTGNHTEAEQAFVAALNDCQNTTGVFKPWAASRSRLAIIQSATKSAGPTLIGAKHGTRKEVGALPVGLTSEMEVILRLDALHRFVFVLTVLEKYSVRDCAILLRRRIPEIEAARLRAMTIVGGHEPQVLAPAINLHAVPVSA